MRFLPRPATRQASRAYDNRWVEPFPLDVAATRLGVRLRAVRRQVQDGRLPGFHLDGQWWVWLPVAGDLPADETNAEQGR